MRPIIVILTAVAFCLGFAASGLSTPAKPLKIEGRVLCFYGRYASMKDWSSTKGEALSVVDVGPKGVTVFIPCSSANDQKS